MLSKGQYILTLTEIVQPELNSSKVIILSISLMLTAKTCDRLSMTYFRVSQNNSERRNTKVSILSVRTPNFKKVQ